MLRIPGVAVMAICLLAAGTEAQANSPPPGPAPIVAFSAGAAGGDSVAFELFRGNRIFLKGTVNGHPVDIMLDSAAERTVMDRSLAQELGMKSAGTMQAPAATSMETFDVIKDTDVSVAGLTLGKLSIWGGDLKFTAAQVGHKIDLVLGAEAFKAALVDIDFEARRIAFHDPAKFHIPPGFRSMAVVPEPGSDGIRTIMLSIEGKAPVATIFDLGSSIPMTISQPYEQAEQFLNGRPSTDILAGGVGGLTPHDVATLHSIKLGDTELRDVPAMFNRGADELPRTGALVGIDVFSRFRLITDYRHDALYLQPNAAAMTQPFLKDRTGLRAAFAGDHLQVVYVSKGSPAERDGWKAGDTVVAINGQKIGPEYSTSALAQWKNGPAGTKVELTRGDGSKQTLTLAEYY